jgi:beta-mannosidase
MKIKDGYENKMKRLDLNKNWMFADFKNQNEWLPATIPGVVYTDLLNAKKIEEPFANDNELKTKWVSETNWIYKTNFDYPEGFDTKQKLYIVFEGLDTVASVILNGKKILDTDNMFLKYEIEISKKIKEKDNELVVFFESPVNYAKKIESKNGKLPVALSSERVYIRKAQYSFGWDWGPTFPTSGIWRPVYLEQKNMITVNNVLFDTLSIKKNKAEVEIKFDLFSDHKLTGDYLTKVILRNDAEIFETIHKTTAGKQNRIKLKIKNPKLWYPAGEGEPDLYDLEIRVMENDSNNIIDSIKKKVGIRTVELKLKEKKDNAFKFVINGKIVFAKGTDWIPADTFLPRVTKDKYYTLLKAAKDCNQNIIRIWGGGIYENDEFYDICDELGLMVWQDFMFACGSYPEQKEFIQNVENEVEQNVTRLQSHPSIVLWCGNNENEWIWLQEQKKSYKQMPGYKIYAKVIPGILKEIDPLRPYWESSPFGFDEDPNSQNSGNRHQWIIWSMWIDYREVIQDDSLFVSEFGFQGPANISTFDKYISAEHRRINSRIFEFHNKQVEGPERLIRFLAGHLPINTNWNDFIYLTQLNQGFALKTCLEHWRSNPKTNGAIIWQLNDCWPVTSWAIMDSELEPKMSYYFVKNAFSDYLIASTYKNNTGSVYFSNNSKKIFIGSVKILRLNSLDGEIKEEATIDVSLKSETKLLALSKNIDEVSDDEIIIVTAYDETGAISARNYFNKSEWKYLTLPDAKITLKKCETESDELSYSIKTNKPAYFVDLYHPQLVFNNRGMIILPDEEVIISAEKKKQIQIKTEDIKIFTLNNYLRK